MPQAAPQAQQKAKTMDEALQESIAAHEEAQPEPHEVEAPEEQQEAQAEAPEGTEATAEAKPEEASKPPAAQAKAGKEAPGKDAKDGKDGKGPTTKPIPALSSWPPHLRDQFHTLPRPIKDQFIKSHGDFVRGLSERDRQISAARQQIEAAKPLSEALAPFMPHLQAVGVAPGAAVRNLFQTEYVLRTGADGQKADIVANLMGAYGVNPANVLRKLPKSTLETLAPVLVAALEGQAPDGQDTPAPAPQQRRQEPVRDPEFAAFKQNLLRQSQAQQAAKDQADEAALHEFLNSEKAEFFDDVAEEMADLAKLQKNKGLSFEQLYEKACLLNDNVRSVLEKRKADEAAALRSQRAQQARKAASSVKTEPGAPQGAKKLSLEDALKANIEAHYGPQVV